ncbi:Uncharacterised protein [Yersinia enterocolitica]|nr:Uncharacterised protein [Yersinia enterocolitica]SUP65828.1 Uncharacterised protein [Yersinia enterocolitica]
MTANKTFTPEREKAAYIYWAKPWGLAIRGRCVPPLF